MAIGTPWQTTSGSWRTGNASSVDVDISSAPVNSVVFVGISFAGSTAAITPPAGWTTVNSSSTSGSVTARMGVYWHYKASSAETTATFSWPTTQHYNALAFGYDGVNPVTPVESAVFLTHSGTAYGTGTVTPTSTGRWIVAFASVIAAGGAQTLSSSAVTERVEVGWTTSATYVDSAVYDTNGTVTAAGHTYAITSTGAPTDGGSIAFALVPGVSGAGSSSGVASASGSGQLGMVASGAASVTATASGSGFLAMFGAGSVSAIASSTADGIDIAPVVPDLKVWQQGDALDADTLNEQWRDIFGVLFGDGRPIIYASYQGTQFNLTSPQAMPLDTVNLQRGDLQLTPGDSKIYAFTAGWYEGVLQGAFNFNGATSSYTLGTQIRVNGTTDASSFNAPISNGLTSSDQVLGGHPFTVYLNAGDYVELVQYGDSWVSGKVRSSTANGGTRVAMWWGGRS